MSGEAPTVGRRLRAEWLAFLGGGGVFLVAGAHLVGAAAGDTGAHRWLLVAGAVVAYEIGFLGYHLGWGRTVRDLPGDSLGVANTVTMGRGLLYAATAGFLLVRPATAALEWAPALCYGAGAALDALDGKLARRNGRATPLGERLDHAFDTLGFLVAPLVGVAWGRLPAVYLALSAARYVFLAGRAWRRWTGRPVHSLPRSDLRRPLAAGQMALIAVALAPVLPTEVVHPAAAAAMVPSLALFGRDWLVVSGRLPRHEE